MANDNSNLSLYPNPPYRCLRGYAFDPNTSLNIDNAIINEIVYKVPWEKLKEGPEGEYVKVIDRDPASNATYIPVNLDEPNILASHGLAPSENNPQFHQQMVYAVAMTTIKNFEKALGRKVMWSPAIKTEKGKQVYEFVPHLLIYPHAIRDQNAYYSPDRKALLFGYYNATPAKTSLFLPGGIVYTCLSHDIIAHETTHALLDGMYSRFMECTHPDVPAFHEGFSDIVALLQHFTLPDIVSHQIRKTKGKLDTENLLVQLAGEFGISSGSYGPLRDPIGSTNKKGEWKATAANSKNYATVLECHDRGEILVSAVFDAFLTIYNNRTADLIRIASGGTGILPEGEIHPDLIKRLSNEACKTASHVLSMCIRALDYCPPVDLNYGDYLRAVITADTELVRDDDLNYRVAFIDAFRKRGIFPEGVSNLSVESLCYNTFDSQTEKNSIATSTIEFLRGFKEKAGYLTNRKEIFDATAEFITGDRQNDVRGLHSLFFKDFASNSAKAYERLTGLVFSDQFRNMNINSSKTYRGKPSVEIHSLRIHNRIGPDGNLQNQVIMTISQRCGVSVRVNPVTEEYDCKTFKLNNSKEWEDGNFIFRGGCTLIFDLNNLKLKHAISKPIFDPITANKRRSPALVLNEERAIMQYRTMYGDVSEKVGVAALNHTFEPLAFIHNRKRLSYE